MGLDFLISISCLIIGAGIGLSLAVQNLKRSEETHDERMAIYRRRKKAKNEALRKLLGLPQSSETQAGSADAGERKSA